MVRSVNNAKDIALKINKAIKESEIYQEYQAYEQKILENEALKKEEAALKRMQQEIVNATYHEAQNAEALKAEYHKRMEAYELHPLVVNYLAAKAALNEYLQYINQYINGGIK